MHARLKQVALKCAKKIMDANLIVMVYHCLSLFKNDPEVEQLFIDYYVEHNDRNDPIQKIINNYWS